MVEYLFIYPIPYKYLVPLIDPTDSSGTSSAHRARRWCCLGPLRTRAGSTVYYTIHAGGHLTMHEAPKVLLRAFTVRGAPHWKQGGNRRVFSS